MSSIEPSSSSFRLNHRWPSIDALINANPDLRLDLGCGKVKPDGYVGIDSLVGVPPDQLSCGQNTADDPQGVGHSGPDLYMDLNHEHLPFPDNSCVEVHARHFLEHSVLDHIFSEVWRVLKPGGVFVIIIPYANSAWGMYPGHNIFLTERFFAESESFAGRFGIERTTYRQDEAWEAWPRLLRWVIPYGWARTHLFNVCKEMRIEAVARKQGPAAVANWSE
jgi:SAM-dependent methyltransferase